MSGEGLNSTQPTQHQPAAAMPLSNSSESAGRSNAASAIGTSQTIIATTSNVAQSSVEVLPLTLRARPSVTWAEGVRDNEGLGRKSSKRCCIFHKQREFGESSTDSSDYDSDRSGSSSASGGAGGDDSGDKKPRAGKKHRRIARPKKGKKVPDYQRYHA